jgi:hypothetical protein
MTTSATAAKPGVLPPAVRHAKAVLARRLRDDATRLETVHAVLFGGFVSLSQAEARAVADCRRWLSGFAARYAEVERQRKEIVPGSDLWRLTMSQAVAEDVERHFAG